MSGAERQWGLREVLGDHCKDLCFSQRKAGELGRVLSKRILITLTSLLRADYGERWKGRNTKACWALLLSSSRDIRWLGPAGARGGSDKRWDLGSTWKVEPS